jgi:hypothetical protein
MDRPDPIESAQALVAHRYPDALQAWLGGSVHAGQLTRTSDLDITVLSRALPSWRDIRYRLAQLLRLQGLPTLYGVYSSASPSRTGIGSPGSSRQSTVSGVEAP